MKKILQLLNKNKIKNEVKNDGKSANYLNHLNEKLKIPYPLKMSYNV